MIEDLIAEKARYIDSVIDQYLPAEEGLARNVICAMNYSIHAGGKRLRPMLMMESCEMFGGCVEGIINPFMAAIEMIHTYSLCHDDLPAMDNDMYRRGKLSTFAKFGEAMGILAGDGLLNYAFETAMGSFDILEQDGLDEIGSLELSYRIMKALRILADKAGIFGMIGGQVVDIETEDKPAGEVTMDTIMYIHEHKTAAMIESSMMIGATLAGAAREQIETLEEVGSDVGLAFQIMDDILDITGDEDVLGKPTGSDEKNNKVTYVSMKGIDKAREDVNRLSQNAVMRLQNLPGSNSKSGVFLKDLIEYLITRSS
ncbi:MAG: polyprenyl synthetase family protein [Lachnospiraceae bacterium]|nr:polyprenyl synthetase family protein [Lachnospiraceae bacterium]